MCCRAGGKLTLDALALSTEFGAWKMPDFKAACSYAAAPGWLIVEGDTLTLTTARLRAVKPDGSCKSPRLPPYMALYEWA
jgi:hypothetical protein